VKTHEKSYNAPEISIIAHREEAISSGGFYEQSICGYYECFDKPAIWIGLIGHAFLRCCLVAAVGCIAQCRTQIIGNGLRRLIAHGPLSAGVTGDLDDLSLTTIIGAAELVIAALTAVGHWLPKLSVLRGWCCLHVSDNSLVLS